MTASSRSSPRACIASRTVNQYTGTASWRSSRPDRARGPRPARLLGGAPSPDEVRRYADELRTARGFNFAVRMGSTRARSWWAGSATTSAWTNTALGTRGLAQRMEQLADRASRCSPNAREARHGVLQRARSRTLPGEGMTERYGSNELEAPAAPHAFDVSRARGLSRSSVARRRWRPSRRASNARSQARARSSGRRRARRRQEPAVPRVRGALSARGSRSSRPTRWRTGRRSRCSPGWSSCGTPSASRSRTAMNGAPEDRRALAPDRSAAARGASDLVRVPRVPTRAPAPRLTPEAMQREVFDIQKRLCSSAPAWRVLAFLLEDLHWFDAASDAMLAALEELTPHTPTLRLTTFRPATARRGCRAHRSAAHAPAPRRRGSRRAAAYLLGTDPSSCH